MGAHEAGVDDAVVLEVVAVVVVFGSAVAS